MKKNVLVTGGAGYIGSHTCKALSLAGFTPVVVDNLSTGHAYAVKWGPFLQIDIQDEEKLKEAFQTYLPIAVIHFAADAIVSESMKDPGKYYRNNLGGLCSLLKVMQQQKVKRIVFSSTCAVYGNPISLPIKENHPINPINPYGRSKRMCEEILSDYQIAHGIEPVILRYFNAAGADLETQIGENHEQETHLIPSIIQAALGMKPHVSIFGTDFKTEDGSAIRDYIHVNDLAAAHIAAIHGPCGTFNLGTGKGYSVLQILESIQNYSEKSFPIVKEERREGDPPLLFADNSLAKEKLQWELKHSDLQTIIGSAWKWHQLIFENAHLVKSALKCLS